MNNSAPYILSPVHSLLYTCDIFFALIRNEEKDMSKLCAYIIIGLVFLFFLIASAISAICHYYYRCKDKLFPVASPVEHLPADDDDTYLAANDVPTPFLAEL